MLTYFAALLLAGAAGCTAKANKTKDKQHQDPTPQPPGGENPNPKPKPTPNPKDPGNGGANDDHADNNADKYKTMDELLKAVDEGKVITPQIAQSLADKLLPNSITNDQLHNLASSVKNDKVIEILAKKTAFDMKTADIDKLLADPSLAFINLTNLLDILKMCDKSSRIAILNKVKKVDPSSLITKLSPDRLVHSPTRNPEAHKTEITKIDIDNKEMQILISKLEFSGTGDDAEKMKNDINEALEKLKYAAETRVNKITMSKKRH
jgi:hypothetical protein